MTYSMSDVKTVGSRNHSLHYVYSAVMGKIYVCTNPLDPCYKWYGFRGIKVYPKWVDQPRLAVLWILNNLGPRPTDDHTIDRVDNNGHFEPGNLRWATRFEQIHNRRTYTNTGEKGISKLANGKYKIQVDGQHLGHTSSLALAILLRDNHAQS